MTTLVFSGEAAVLRIHGDRYAVRRDGDAWTLLSFEGAEYHVLDYSCTCPDSRFRGHICKHVEGLRCLR